MSYFFLFLTAFYSLILYITSFFVAMQARIAFQRWRDLGGKARLAQAIFLILGAIFCFLLGCQTSYEISEAIWN